MTSSFSLTLFDIGTYEPSQMLEMPSYFRSAEYFIGEFKKRWPFSSLKVTREEGEDQIAWSIAEKAVAITTDEMISGFMSFNPTGTSFDLTNLELSVAFVIWFRSIVDNNTSVFLTSFSGSKKMKVLSTTTPEDIETFFVPKRI